MDNTPSPSGNRGAKLLRSRVEPLGHGLCFLTEFGLEPLKKRCLQVLSGHCTNTYQEAGKLRAQPLAGCPRLPPLCTLASELLWKNGIVLEIGTLEIVLDENILASTSVGEGNIGRTVRTCIRLRQDDLQCCLDFLRLGALIVVHATVRRLRGRQLR